MKTKLFFILVWTVLFYSAGFAQDGEKRFGFEFSPGVSMATAKLAGVTLNPGFGFEGIFHYQFLSQLGVYGGWGWNRFGADESFAGNDAAIEETGYVLGLQFLQPVRDNGLSLYLRAGTLYGHIETENSEGNVIHDTGHGLGYQLAGGLSIPLGNNWNLTPGVKFNSLSRDSEFESMNLSFKQDYVSLRFGILKKF